MIEQLLLLLHVYAVNGKIVEISDPAVYVKITLFCSSIVFGWPEMTESLNHFTEQLQWAVNYDGRPEMLQGLKEIGSLIFWMSLLDTAMVS